MSAVRLPPVELMSQSRSASAFEHWFIAGIWTTVLGFFLLMRFLVLGGGQFHVDPDALAQMLTRFPEKLRDDPVHFVDLLLLLLIAVAHVWFSRRRAKLERLFLDETGIRYQSPLPEVLSWSLQWSQLRELEPGPPELDFSKYSYYWHQFKLGTIHQFELRKGGLGFYQVNMEPVREKMRAYFRGSS